MITVRKWISKKLPTDYFFPLPNPLTWLVHQNLLHLSFLQISVFLYHFTPELFSPLILIFFISFFFFTSQGSHSTFASSFSSILFSTSLSKLRGSDSARWERETRSYRTPIKFKKGKQEARIHTGRKMNFGRNWPECPERGEI